MGFRWASTCALALALLLTACAREPRTIGNAELADEQDGTNWPAFGRTFGEGHYSPLKQIDETTVARLGLAWSLDLDVHNAITAPLAVDGVIYLAAGHGVVHAVQAKTGKLLWRYDAKAPEAAGEKLRVAWGIRGLAFWKDRVYAGTSDGRLIALNAKDGTLAWSTLTVDPKNGAVITGAPRAFNGKIVIGFAGGDFGALRGYVTAYDAADGTQLWRFFVVPGKPGTRDGAASDDVQDMMAATWTGEWWKNGGGAAVWNAMTYDPEFNRLYIGTGNGTPMNWKLRSPQGGDNLFIASVVALDADTGKYAWHYQTTPGDSWDYDSATDMTLVTLKLDGRDRKVMLHAAKNGFLYVIDRENGKLVSADKLGTVTWAERIDLESGKPVLAPGAKYEQKPILLWPSFQAVHHWLPQSFSPQTGYLYEPTLEMPAEFGDAGVDLAELRAAREHRRLHRPHRRRRRRAEGCGPQRAEGLGSGGAQSDVAGGDAGRVERRDARDRGRDRVPGPGRWLRPRVFRARRQGSLVLLRRRRGDRRAHHLQRRREAIRLHHVRAARRIDGRVRLDLRSVGLGSTNPSAPVADVCARCEGDAAAHAAAAARGAAGRPGGIHGRRREGQGRRARVRSLHALPRHGRRGRWHRAGPAGITGAAVVRSLRPRGARRVAGHARHAEVRGAERRAARVAAALLPAESARDIAAAKAAPAN